MTDHPHDVGWPDPKHSENREGVPLEELDPYRGRQVAWSWDGTRILAAADVGLVAAPVRYAVVELRLSDGQEFRRWPAWVGFTAARLKQPPLGFAGCLQFFGALFRGNREEVELDANAVRSAVASVLKAGRPRTPDLGGKDGTKEVAGAVLAAL